MHLACSGHFYWSFVRPGARAYVLGGVRNGTSRSLNPIGPWEGTLPPTTFTPYGHVHDLARHKVWGLGDASATRKRVVVHETRPGPFQGSRRPMLGGPNPLFPLSGPCGGQSTGCGAVGRQIEGESRGLPGRNWGAMFGHYKDLMVKSGAYQASRGVFRVLCMEADSSTVVPRLFSSISHYFYYFLLFFIFFRVCRYCYINATSWNTEIQHAIRLHIALLAVRGIWPGDRIT